MNYPLWDLPASGLLIAFVAIVHVIVSHFAVGGGLFLVLTERKARRDGDARLLEFVRTHTRFFTLLTLVFGAITGVGIWFTIGLVHPAATSSLINTFVWGWAIEWTFFFVEITAAMVYFYGWDRLEPRVHLAVGWIYFWAAWLSLAVINGILTFMLTPGAWLTTRSFWDGVLNPTYLPALVARTAGSIGLAGAYALVTAAWSRDAALRAAVGRYAVVRWIAPMVVVLPLSVLWTLYAAAGAGVPVGDILGATRTGFAGAARSIFTTVTSGYPLAQTAARVIVVASVVGVALCVVVLGRRGAFGLPLAGGLMLCASATFGAAEWLREDLRKPFVIGNYMLINGVRLADAGEQRRPGSAPDPYALDTLNNAGVLPAALWTRLPPDIGSRAPGEQLAAKGSELFRLECSTCHTLDGHLAIRPLVRSTPAAALDTMLGRLSTWRGRRMPPFAGTGEERQALAVYLATLGGAPAEPIPASAGTGDGGRFFDENCSMCHGREADFPFDAKGRSPEAIYELLGRLASINEIMPPLEATDVQRRALAAHLATLTGKAKGASR